jgi:hypothetical protein
MPGQLSNYLKNFNKIIDDVNTYMSAVGNLLSSLKVARNVFTNLNKLDDNSRTSKDKAVDTAKAAAVVTSLIPNPIIAPITTGVVETASYLTDFQEERKDALPKPTDINNRTNSIGSGVKNVINSTPIL